MGYSLIKDTTSNEANAVEANVVNYKSFFNEIWKGKKPIAELFRTPARGYLYDTGTNKIIGCHDLVFILLEYFFTHPVDKAVDAFLEKYDLEEFYFAAETIKSTIETEKILLASNIEKMDFSPQFIDYKELVNSSLETLLLEVTTRCNLRCAYCVYDCHVKDKRNHSSNDMPISIAYQAVDYLKAHSIKSKKVAVSFFGGEPLLVFSTLKKVVDYSRSILDRKDLYFFITTNATLITTEIAEFLFKNDFTVFCSIDGPEDIHNDFRIDGGGIGSFQKSIEGVKTLVEFYGADAHKKIKFSMVYTPPFSEERLNRIAELWEKFPWLPWDMNLSITYPSYGSIQPHKTTDLAKEDKTLMQWSIERFYEKYSGKGKSHPIANAIVEKNLAMITGLPIYTNPSDQFYPTGCCLPGVKRLFVSTDGTFRICERISTFAPDIGNIHSGIDIDKIKKIYIEDYQSLSAPSCSKCWAVRLCTSCYVDGFENDALDLTRKSKSCRHIKDVQKFILEYYCFLKEQNPDGLDYLKDYEFF